MSSTETNKQIVRKFLAALENLDVERFLSFLTDDVHFETTGQHQASGIKTKDQVGKELPAMRALLPEGLKFTEVSILAEGDWVAIELRGEAKTVNGDDYNNHYAHFYKIRDGKIALFRDYMDSTIVERLMIPFFATHGATAKDRERENSSTAA